MGNNRQNDVETQHAVYAVLSGYWGRRACELFSCQYVAYSEA